MPDPYYYKGYTIWPTNKAGFPEPIPNDIQVDTASKNLSAVTCRARFPAAIPANKVYMERSAGIARAWRFTVAIVATKKAGQVNGELVCTAQHLNWCDETEYGETGAGNVQTFVVKPGDLAKNNSVSLIYDSQHGPVHFDRVTLYCELLATGELFIQMIGAHQLSGKAGVIEEPKVTPPEGGEPPVGGAPPGGSKLPGGKGKQPPKEQEEPKPKPVAMRGGRKKRGES